MSLAIVTGSSTGLGYFTALGLAANGFERVVITSRKLERAQEAAKKLKRLSSGTDFLPYQLELHDLERVQQFAELLVKNEGNWDLLVNNAGAKIERPTKLTAQGFEWHYGVNHLAHFALTSWLRKNANRGARVVSNASIAAARGNSDLWVDATAANASEQYCASKLANLCFAMSLSETGLLNSNAAHPGFARAEAYGSPLVRLSEYLFAQSAKAGAMPIIEACVNEAKSGIYFAPAVKQLWGKPELVRLPRTANLENQKKIWQISESQLGFKF